MSSTSPAAQRLTFVQWLICGMAAIGFAFDIYVLLMLPLILGPALSELGHLQPGTPEYTRWAGLLFYVPAFAGGIFGLLGGYLTDLLGRRRILTWSILLYAFSTLASGFSSSLEWLLFYRCLTFVGVCVEFVAAVAWLAELFPNPKQRESVLGITQAFSSTGGLMAAAAWHASNKFALTLPVIADGHEAWRYALISGVIPAIPLVLIRPFLPESPAWQEKKARGTLKRPGVWEVFRPEFRRTTIVSTLMFACSLGAAFGAIQHLPRIVPGLPEVKSLPKEEQQVIVAKVQYWQETGGLVGRCALAALAMVIVGRRKLLRIFQLPGLVIVPLVFIYPAVTSLEWLKAGVFVVGFLTVAQLSFWGNYLPRMYPIHLRGTGESFAANIGGRMIGTSAAFVTTQLALQMPGTTVPMRLSYAAAAVGFAVYAIGTIACFWLPEPPREEFAE